ncbi:unnamed protein product [Ranitomeya imitator]|uniref:Fibronectin type-III domain-containing protein n=1 Tax=Ranitomeya imitator TaxID=111125 RepID=A0ABN9L0K9_9NEOB|nr:unnamed protein product [Ranitomeya imitator]
MLRYVFGFSLWIMLSCIQDVEPVKCTINITESKVFSQSVYVKWSSSGSLCNFSMICRSSNFWENTCNPIQKTNDSYECRQSGLEAGTLYDISIVALQDGEAKNLTLQTALNPLFSFTQP